MSRLLSTTKIIDTDISIRALNVISNTLNKLAKDITLADVMDNKDLIFNSNNCIERTKKEISMLIAEYLLS